MTSISAMHYEVRHTTQVRYDALVKLARFNLRLIPADWPGQTLLSHRLEVMPQPGSVTTEIGPFVVNTSKLMLAAPTSSLTVTSTFLAVVDRPFVEPGVDAPSIAEVRAEAQSDRGLSVYDPASYLFASPIAGMSAEIAEWAAPMLGAGASVVAAATALMQAIHADFTYDGRVTTVSTPPLEAFLARSGVCQDFAHIMIVALRSFGIPAAYVSGYLRTIPPPGRKPLVGADASHAWVSVWCGKGLGWIGFDPTNAMLVGNDHIFAAMGRDFADVSPLDGVFLGVAGQRMTVSVDVRQVEP